MTRVNVKIDGRTVPAILIGRRLDGKIQVRAAARVGRILKGTRITVADADIVGGMPPPPKPDISKEQAQMDRLDRAKTAMIAEARRIADEMIAKDPANKALYERRYQAYAEDPTNPKMEEE